MKLLIVRHGQCVANVEGIVAGSNLDSPLTAQGEAEARAAGERLRGYQIDQIIASPLSRAYKTAEIIREIAHLTASIQIDPDFIERNSGAANGTDRLKYLADLRAGVIIPGAESLDDLFARAKAGLSRINPELNCILIATHGGIARAIECVVTGRPADDIRGLIDLKNGEVRELEFSV